MIPEFEPNGLLPPGVHECTMDEIRQRFCRTDHRLALFSGLERFLDEWWKPKQIEAVLLIDGSFVREKQQPGDIDIVLDISTLSKKEAVFIACELDQDRLFLKSHYNVDVYPEHPSFPNRLSSFFQYAGDKCAIELQIDPHYKKGILKVLP